MEPILIAVAFGCGMVVNLIGLPPLLGFLAAGFILNGMGYENTPALSEVADLGVTLLLFTIGLKLNIKTLMRRDVWGTTSLHLLLSTLLFTVVLLVCKGLGLELALSLDWKLALLLGFALSFSSTVFAVKVLEDRSDMNALYARIAIGVLVMQDVFAVAFLAFSSGKWPSIWALWVLGLPLLRPLLFKLLERAGHGELQVLFGVFLALVVGAAGFEVVGLKPDLGALIIGMMLASHPAAAGLAKALFNLKDLFLVCFFLTIGLNGLPTHDTMLLALALVLALPLKSVLYYLVYSGAHLRVRTALLSTLALTNFSEFGLIVAAIAAKAGWLSYEWLVAVSLALAASFMISAPLNAQSERIYHRIGHWLKGLQASNLHPEDRPIELGDAEVIILGMGRIGQGAYFELENKYGNVILGVENDSEKLPTLRAQGMNVIEGDATDTDFWDKVLLSNQVNLVLLAMPHHSGNLYAIEKLRSHGFNGKIAAIVRFEDDIASLREQGVDAVFNVYNEAGSGFARHVIRRLQPL
ncbi:cation:proton antiporter family protein [Aeromonas veronii]|uniref:cation:proton antiporter family protein n=1 Tax=Aeromonas veronii TaxID=654 RepID=UPI001FD6EDD7|nr:cation:proton antiporter family protein [Aeromonas veronii]MCJ8216187.1 cation:proton antiporter [Aeromonas veronii]USP59902.1 cation:proton antiporter [Aeromonas veronii]